MFYLKNKTVRHIHLLQRWPHCVCAKMHFWLSCPFKPIYKSFAEFKSSSFLEFKLFFGSAQHWSGLVLLTIFHSWTLIDCFPPSHSVSISNQRSWKDYMSGKLNMLANSWRSHLWVNGFKQTFKLHQSRCLLCMLPLTPPMACTHAKCYKMFRLGQTLYTLSEIRYKLSRYKS